MPSDAAQTVAEFRRYAEVIRGLLRSGGVFVPEAESATVVQVERGVVFAQAIVDARGVDQQAAARLIELAFNDRLSSIAVVDRSGHHRPVYRGLLVYSWLQAFGLVYEMLSQTDFGRWEEGLRPWCDLLESELGQIEWPASQPMPAGRGSSATESAWIALALHVAGKRFVRDAWTDLASDTFGKLVRSQNLIGTGSFLLASASDNPETHWYHELVLLHAAASYAVQAEDRTLAGAVAQNAEFHQQQTQPDHATTQPWAAFAFVWNPNTRLLAEQVLHAATVRPSGVLDGVSLMLLADALYCLELFTTAPSRQ
ncbi:hypothetical protein [Fontivita pretiosa]|uniref:hypothetical protein n=1 Tax=Fontivita pretiosa TaxID=2989684 RepID=UPI003D183C70